MNQIHITTTPQIQTHFNYSHYQSNSPFALHVSLDQQNVTISVAPEQFFAFLLECKNNHVTISIQWNSSLIKRLMFIANRSVHNTVLSHTQVIRFLALTGYKVECSTWQKLAHFFKSSHSLCAQSLLQAAKEDTVSVIIPCKNEAGNIERALRELPDFGQSLEIIFVEGLSQDNTWEEIERVQNLFSEKKIKRIKQSGKGKAAAVKDGFAAATGNILIILDGDLTVKPAEIRYCYAVMQRNSNVFINGTRMLLTMERNATPFLNYFCNKAFAYLLSIYTQTPLTDTLCGTKVLTRENYIRITQLPTYLSSVDPFGDFTLLLGAYDLGLPIVEVPFNYKARTYGTTQIRRFKNGFDLLIVLGFYSLKRLQQLWRKAYVCNFNKRK